MRGRWPSCSRRPRRRRSSNAGSRATRRRRAGAGARPLEEPGASPPVRRGPSTEPSRRPRLLEPFPEPAPRLHRAPLAGPSAYFAVIRVVGVGGAGLNAINRMIDAGISDVEFLVVNTDVQQLALSDARAEDPHRPRAHARARLGRRRRPRPVGRRGDPRPDQGVLRGSDIVFVTAGEGGGTGSGAAPVVARIARESVRSRSASSRCRSASRARKRAPRRAGSTTCASSATR